MTRSRDDSLARFISLTLLLICVAVAQADVVLPPPGTAGWRVLEFPKVPEHTRYDATTSDGVTGVRAVSVCAASALYVATEQIDLRRTPRLQWRWKVEEGLEIANERVKAGDDFAARVYVMFRFDPQHASLWERARHFLATKLYGNMVPGHAINYVWSSREPAGAAWDNPFAAASKMVSLGSGSLPQWTDAGVDVAADHLKFFGHAPPELLAIALMTDSDNTCQTTIADYAEFRFVGPQVEIR